MSDPQQPQGTPTGAPAPGPSRKPIVLAMAALAVVGAGLLWFALRGKPEVPEPAAPSSPPVAAAPTPDAQQAAPTTPTVPLPPLGQSDARVRELVGPLSPIPELAKWLASTEDLVRRFTTAAGNIAEGESPRAALSFMAPVGTFQVVEREGHTFIAPESYARYDVVSRVFSSLDTQASVRTYQTLKPLIDGAYKEISRPGQRFEQTLSNAIQRLLDTPVPEGELEVVDTPGVNYAYAAPELEQLSAAQKHLLRMGPANARAIQTKLRELQGALALPRASR
ncbi:hypothetical protein ATI61_103195 [Archangium gephyra]|uniref:DUF3014 domain-containing protein n=1 Tax=Archangium gephyra TaxID=48 RepID=A0AAC8TCZ2_9BACT|nr:DUF3014 domain-containing protein [Archangium gephyra]AKJ01487.1 Hypothetical protein AA314_03113 [Archangium gephyra]REG34302.1 hypothetical protein ATI61_103195 [Archangium gephyra]